MSWQWPVVRALVLFALVLGGAAPSPAGEGERVTTRDLLESPDRWHGQPVVLVGTVTSLEAKTSARDNSYFTFRLADEAGSVTVFAYGNPEVRNGHRVRVEGIFHKVKRVGTHTFRNQVDATGIRPSSDAPRP
jgi:hypothetical protein